MAVRGGEWRRWACAGGKAAAGAADALEARSGSNVRFAAAVGAEGGGGSFGGQHGGRLKYGDVIDGGGEGHCQGDPLGESIVGSGGCVRIGRDEAFQFQATEKMK